MNLAAIPQEPQTRLKKYRRDTENIIPFSRTERDLKILDLVYRYRYLEARHIQALIPGNDRQVARRLQALYHHEYLDRKVPPSKMRLAGSPKMVYVLDTKGADELAKRLYWMPVHKLSWRKAQNRRTEYFIEHQIEITNFRATVDLACANAHDLELTNWLREDEKIRDRYTSETRSAGEQEFRVSPDGYFVVTESGVRRNFFLEIDRGREQLQVPHKKGQTEKEWRKQVDDLRPIFKKYEGYASYLQHQHYLEKYKNASDVRVLFVTTSPARRDRMIETLAKVQVKGMKRVWFWFSTFDDYSITEPGRVLGPIWHTLRGNGKTLFK